MDAIIRSKILAVEGKDEENFFNAFLKVLEISDVQVINFEGKSNFASKIYTLPKIPGFDKVTRIGFVRDAETNEAKSAFDSINAALNKAHLDSVSDINTFTKNTPSIGIFIMPDNSSKGMLEDLCLNYITDLSEKKCIDGYFDCLNNTPKEKSKAMVQVFLAGKSPLVNSLGLGALNKHFDFSSKHFEKIKSFLLTFK